MAISRVVSGAAVLAGVAVGTVRWVQSHRPSDGKGAAADGQTGRWRVVTINKPQDEVAPGGRPRPARGAGRRGRGAAPAGAGRRGTEVFARLRRPEPAGLANVAARVAGDDPAQRVRSALRRSKQLVEVGQVLRVDPQPVGKRHALGKPLELAARRAGGEGVL